MQIGSHLSFNIIPLLVNSGICFKKQKKSCTALSTSSKIQHFPLMGVRALIAGDQGFTNVGDEGALESSLLGAGLFSSSDSLFSLQGEKRESLAGLFKGERRRSGLLRDVLLSFFFNISIFASSVFLFSMIVPRLSLLILTRSGFLIGWNMELSLFRVVLFFFKTLTISKY